MILNMFISSDFNRNSLQIKEIQSSSHFCSEMSVIGLSFNLCLWKSERMGSETKVIGFGTFN